MNDQQPVHSPENTMMDDARYALWKAKKLQGYPTDVAQIITPIGDINAITLQERKTIKTCVDKTNMVICHARNPPSKTMVHQLGVQFGLSRLDTNIYAEEDAITALSVQNTPSRQQAFIPYTNKPLSWHTDGYYNTPNLQIRAMILYCETPAPNGGDNTLLDHEMAYIWLREENPAFITALSDPTVLTIPAHRDEDGSTKRPDQTGPVFSYINGHLHMRYTHRKRNVIWRDDPTVKAALSCLQALFDSDSAYLFNTKLESGYALLCNNVLHNRTAFEEHAQQTRLLYRARYYDRIG